MFVFCRLIDLSPNEDDDNAGSDQIKEISDSFDSSKQHEARYFGLIILFDWSLHMKISEIFLHEIFISLFLAC